MALQAVYRGMSICASSLTMPQVDELHVSTGSDPTSLLLPRSAVPCLIHERPADDLLPSMRLFVPNPAFSQIHQHIDASEQQITSLDHLAALQTILRHAHTLGWQITADVRAADGSWQADAALSHPDLHGEPPVVLAMSIRHLPWSHWQHMDETIRRSGGRLLVLSRQGWEIDAPEGIEDEVARVVMTTPIDWHLGQITLHGAPMTELLDDTLRLARHDQPTLLRGGRDGRKRRSKDSGPTWDPTWPTGAWIGSFCDGNPDDREPSGIDAPRSFWAALLHAHGLALPDLELNIPGCLHLLRQQERVRRDATGHEIHRSSILLDEDAATAELQRLEVALRSEYAAALGGTAWWL